MVVRRSRVVWAVGIAVWAVALAGAFRADTWFYRSVSRSVAETAGYKPWRFEDRDVARDYLHSRRSRSSGLREALELFKRMGHAFFVVLVSVTMVLLDPKRLRQVGALWLCVLVAAGLTELGKHASGRLRPNARLEAAQAEELVARHGKGAVVRISHPDGVVHANRGSAAYRAPFRAGGGPLSFPSGHTVLAFATFTALGRFFPRGRHLFLALACGVAMSRCLMGEHFLSDVVAGAGLGHATARGVLALLTARSRGGSSDPRPASP